MVVSAFITSLVRIRRVVSKNRDDGAAETDCANGQDQKSVNLREHLGVRRENYGSYSRHSFCGNPDHRACICLELKRFTPELRRNLHSSFLDKAFFAKPTPFGRSRLIRRDGI
jgi:hypothetical protein